MGDDRVCVVFEVQRIAFSLDCSMLFPTERFYRSVHSGLRPASGSTAPISRCPFRAATSGPNAPSSGISRCPFRAAIQSKTLHANAVDSHSEAAPSVVKEKDEEKCEVRRSTKDGHCECAVQGLQPIGK